VNRITLPLARRETLSLGGKPDIADDRILLAKRETVVQGIIDGISEMGNIMERN
jgi:hypothetical protein